MASERDDQPSDHGAREAAFRRVMDRQIRPKVATLRRDRKGVRARTLRDITLLVLVGLGIAVILVYGDDQPIPISILVGLTVALMASIPLVLNRQEAWNKALAEAAMPDICDMLGDMTYSFDGKGAGFVGDFEAAGLLPGSTSEKLRHHIRGTYRGTRFDFCEARLNDRSGSSRTRAFSGLLFRITMPTPAPVHVRIGPTRTGPFSRAMTAVFGADPPPVTIGAPDFEDRFTVYASDPQVARDLVTPGVQEALMAIEDEENESQFPAVSAAFLGDTFYLAMTRREVLVRIGTYKIEWEARFMEAGIMLASEVAIEKRIQQMFIDATMIHRILDRVHGHT